MTARVGHLKPHITRLVQPIWRTRLWRCRSHAGVGWGLTPREAYHAWRCDVTDTERERVKALNARAVIDKARGKPARWLA